jgi:lipoprotein-releasing system permease protein
MRFEAQVAARHLKSGGRQTLLTVSAVAVAVTVVIFITSLIKGVQKLFFGDLIGTIPHITVRPFEPKPQTLAQSQNPLQTQREQSSGAHLTTRREKQSQQRKYLENWRQFE